MKITEKIYLQFLTVLIMTGLIGGLAIFSINSVSSEILGYSNSLMPAKIALSHIAVDIQHIMRATEEYDSNWMDRTGADEIIELKKQDIENDLKKISSVSFVSRMEIEEVRSLLNRLYELSSMLFYRHGESLGKRTPVMNEFDETIKKIEKKIDALMSEADESSEISMTLIKNRIGFGRAAIIAMFGLLGIATLLVSFFVSRSIVNSILKLEKAAIEIGRGNLDTRVDIRSNDEIRLLADSFNRMTEDIRHFMEKEKELAARAAAADSEKKKSAELEKAYNELKKTQALLIQSEKLSALGELGAGVAHELSSPLTGIISLVSFYKNVKDPGSEEFRTLIEIEDACKHMSEIIKNFHAFTNMSSSGTQRINCNEMIEATLNFSAHLLEKKGVRIEKKYSAELPQIIGEKTQLQQVIINVITNARDAVDDNGLFRISTRSALINNELFAEMEFSDNGCGISEKDVGKIFDPFFTTKRPGKGIGLGLSISYTIIKKHNGNIIVDSKEGGGTSVIIRLPAAPVFRENTKNEHPEYSHS